MQLRLNRVFAAVVTVGFAYLFYTYAAGHSNFFTRHITHQRERAKNKVELVQLNYLIPDFAPLVGFSQGQADLQPSDWKKYAQYYEKVRELMPQRWDVYVFLGYCYAYLGQTAEAAQAFERSIVLNPQSFWSYYNLGILTARAGNCPAAAAVLARAVDIPAGQTAKNMYTSKLYLDLRNSSGSFDQLTESHLKTAYENAYRFGVMAAHCQPGSVINQQLQALAGQAPVLIF